MGQILIQLIYQVKTKTLFRHAGSVRGTFFIEVRENRHVLAQWMEDLSK